MRKIIDRTGGSKCLTFQEKCASIERIAKKKILSSKNITLIAIYTQVYITKVNISEAKPSTLSQIGEPFAAAVLGG